ncbi:methylated-DNA--[protein]-cysteine S-methyltransferase, partial [Holdemania massiliensis]
TACLWSAFTQLQEYLTGKRQTFELILHPEGTDFQKAAWQALMEIPYGQTWTYRQQAESISKPKAVRAIGMANHRNPIPIFIPCHRVIGADGSLTGYGGGLEIKQSLLDLERLTVEKQREAEMAKAAQ